MIRSILLTALAVSLAGCGPEKTEEPAPKTTPTPPATVARGENDELAGKLLTSYQQCLAFQKQITERKVTILLNRRSEYGYASRNLCATDVDAVSFLAPVQATVKGKPISVIDDQYPLKKVD